MYYLNKNSRLDQEVVCITDIIDNLEYLYEMVEIVPEKANMVKNKKYKQMHQQSSFSKEDKDFIITLSSNNLKDIQTKLYIEKSKDPCKKLRTHEERINTTNQRFLKIKKIEKEKEKLQKKLNHWNKQILESMATKFHLSKKVRVLPGILPKKVLRMNLLNMIISLLFSKKWIYSLVM